MAGNDVAASTPGSAPAAAGSGSRACARRSPSSAPAPRSGRRRRSCPSSRTRSVRSFSMFGGETTCSHTSPRSSAIEDSRLPYDSRVRVLAEVGRADRGGLLAHVHPVSLGEQREDAVRVVRGDRLPVLRGQVAVHDRRLGALGRVVDRVGVLEPGGVAWRAPRSPGTLRVEPVVLVHQRVGGQLVQQHHHDRRARHAPDRAALASLGKASSEIWPLSRNSSRNTSGAGESTFRNERTGSARAQRRGRGADRDGQDDQHACPRRRATSSAPAPAISATSAPEEDHVRGLPHLRPDQPEQQLDRRAGRRRQHHQQHREADDVEARRAARGEELGVVLQEVEQRLCNGEGPEDREVQVAPRRPLFRGRSLCSFSLLGRA